jgi:hypothetical protein
MSGDLELLLARLHDDMAPPLAGVEDSVCAEIRRRKQARSFLLGEAGRNTGIAAAALLLGVAIAATRPLPPPRAVSISLLLTEVPPASLLE